MPARRERQAASPRLSRVVESWLAAVEVAGRSTATLALYRNSLSTFIGEVGDLPLGEVTADHCRAFLRALRQRGAKPASLHTRYRNLRTFFAWCEAEEKLDRSPMRRVEPPQQPQTSPPGFSTVELQTLVSACNRRTAIGARDRAILLVLAGTGLRLGELAALRRSDVERSGATEQHIRVRGKGNRERLISLEPVVRAAVVAYLEFRDDDQPALWLGERGALGASAIYHRLRELGRQCGLEDVHPHRFRHYAAANWLAAGLDVLTTQRLLGHSNVTITQFYAAHRELVRANDRLLELAPLSKLDWSGGKRKRRP